MALPSPKTPALPRPARLLLLCLPLAVLLQTDVLAFLFPDYFLYLQRDLIPYHLYALATHRGLTPYLDFRFEYPPLALIYICLPQLLHFWAPIPFQIYCLGIYALNGLCTLLFGLAAFPPASFFATPRQATTTAAKLLLMVAVCLPLSLFHFDILLALLTAVAFRALMDERPLSAGIFIGLGIATKLYPLVLLAIFVPYLLATGRKGQLRPLLLGTALPQLLCLPLFWNNPDWPLDFLGYHLHRGLQIESVAANLLMIWHKLQEIPYTIVFNFGAYHLDSPLNGKVMAALSLAAPTAALLLAVTTWRWFCRENETTGTVCRQTLSASCLAILMVMILFNKVFSPQYIIWLLPFLFLLDGTLYIKALMVAAATAMIYPHCYIAVSEGQDGGILLVGLRNGIFLYLFVHLLIAFQPGSKEATPPSTQPRTNQQSLP